MMFSLNILYEHDNQIFSNDRSYEYKGEVLKIHVMICS